MCRMKDFGWTLDLGLNVWWTMVLWAKKWEGSGMVVDGERARRTVCICGISEWRCRQSRPQFRGEVHDRDTHLVVSSM